MITSWLIRDLFKPNIAPGADDPMRFLRLKEVQRLTGLPRSTIYEMVNAGEFPRQFRISKRIAAWLASEIAAWQTAQLASRERDGKAA